MTQEWTPERAAALIALWNEGVCASEIGRQLCVTKNAVIGKASRLQLPKRRLSSPTQADDQSVIRLEQLGAGMCSWPLGAPEKDGFHFCGAAGKNPIALRIAVWPMYQQPKTEGPLRPPDSLQARIQIRATLHILRTAVLHTADGSAVY